MLNDNILIFIIVLAFAAGVIVGIVIGGNRNGN